MSVSAQEATRTIDCRAPGCTNTAATDRGIYAYLCDQHADQKRRTGVSPRPSDAQSAGGSPRRTSGPGDSLEAKVKELGKLGRDADRARAKAKKAAESALKLKAAADALEQTFRARTRELMSEA